jgi:hypothetical protein
MPSSPGDNSTDPPMRADQPLSTPVHSQVRKPIHQPMQFDDRAPSGECACHCRSGVLVGRVRRENAGRIVRWTRHHALWRSFGNRPPAGVASRSRADTVISLRHSRVCNATREGRRNDIRTGVAPNECLHRNVDCSYKSIVFATNSSPRRATSSRMSATVWARIARVSRWTPKSAYIFA